MKALVMTIPEPSTSHADDATPRLLSIVMPCHNEQEVLPETYRRTAEAAQSFRAMGLETEILFVNDGSRDRTAEIMTELAGKDSRVRSVHLTRNFGHQAAVSAGLSLVRGDVVAVMDADLQDPPEVLPRFLEHWEQGYQVVYAVREKRKEWFGKRIAYWGFYRLLAAISEIDMPLDSGDFCVMDRSAVDLINALPERQRFVRGLRTWVGLKQIGITYERDARQGGAPSYTFRSLVKLAMDGLVSFSAVPLKLVTRLGVIGVIAALLLAAWVVLDTLFIGKAPRGWASLAFLVLITSSVQMISLGIIGEYLAHLYGSEGSADVSGGSDRPAGGRGRGGVTGCDADVRGWDDAAGGVAGECG